mmetsp:Transcript_12121/g.25102  ORF Transcript_12121/g.25102 Transcript_12121/m.25102 type:complete len:104 (+) Transcript_12121:818-1129(+)
MSLVSPIYAFDQLSSSSCKRFADFEIIKIEQNSFVCSKGSLAFTLVHLPVLSPFSKLQQSSNAANGFCYPLRAFPSVTFSNIECASRASFFRNRAMPRACRRR